MSVAFLLDGLHIASASSDHTIRLWNTTTLECVATLVGHEGGMRAVVCGSIEARSIIVSGSGDTTVRIWDADTAAMMAVLHGHSATVNCVALSPDGKRIASGSRDHTVRLWDTTSKAVLARFKGHTNSVWAVAFSPDGNRIASGSHDGTVRFWDVRTQSEVTPKLEHPSNKVWSIAFSPDGSRLVAGLRSRAVSIWDLNTRTVVGVRTTSRLPSLLKRLAKKMAHKHDLNVHTWTVLSVAFTASGTYVVSGSADRTIRIWNAATGESVAAFRCSSGVFGTALSPDDSRLVAGLASGRIQVWDMSLRRDHGAARDSHIGLIFSVVFSPDGTRVATGSDDNTARLWDVRPGRCTTTLAHEKWVTCVQFSPDGARLASGSDDAVIRIWKTCTGKRVTVLRMKANDQHIHSIIGRHPDRRGTWIGLGDMEPRCRSMHYVAGCRSGRTPRRLLPRFALHRGKSGIRAYEGLECRLQ